MKKVPQETLCVINRLRDNEKMSYNRIVTKLKSMGLSISKGTLSKYLKGRKLPADVLKKALLRGASKTGMKKRSDTINKFFVDRSKFYSEIYNKKLSKSHVSKISESAVLYRLSIYGFNVYSSVFDGERTDFIVEYPALRKIFRIQVKTCKRKGGAPTIPLTRTEGHDNHIRYLKGEFDFIVGFDIYTDTAYVFSEKEVKNNKNTISVTADSKENWKKLLRE